MNPALIVIGILAAFYYYSNNAIGSLVYNVNGVNFSGGKLVLSFQIINPSSQQFALRSIVGNLTYNGQVIGNVSSLLAVNIPPNSKVSIPVNVSLNTLGIAQEITLLFEGQGTSGNFGLAANINIAGVVVNKIFTF
jgi:LEA14-like dessication related protein